MTNLLDDENGSFLILVNDKGQHSLWPKPIKVPDGWSVAHGPDSRQNCLVYVKENSIDTRPASLRRAMERAAVN
jgi:MbtH protein